MAASLKLEEAAFRAFLTQKPAGTLVGRAVRPMDCPLARWLNTLMKPGVAVVVAVTWFKIVEGPQRDLPEWAVAFMRRLLLLTPGSAVSREQALQLLDG